jgi:hypothetical protein
MPFAAPVNPYAELDDRDSFMTVRQCAAHLGMTEERVCELARQGTLRSRGRLVQPALIPGYTA